MAAPSRQTRLPWCWMVSSSLAKPWSIMERMKSASCGSTTQLRVFGPPVGEHVRLATIDDDLEAVGGCHGLISHGPNVPDRSGLRLRELAEQLAGDEQLRAAYAGADDRDVDVQAPAVDQDSPARRQTRSAVIPPYSMADSSTARSIERKEHLRTSSVRLTQIVDVGASVCPTRHAATRSSPSRRPATTTQLAPASRGTSYAATIAAVSACSRIDLDNGDLGRRPTRTRGPKRRSARATPDDQRLTGR